MTTVVIRTMVAHGLLGGLGVEISRHGYVGSDPAGPALAGTSASFRLAFVDQPDSRLAVGDAQLLHDGGDVGADGGR